MVNARWRWVVFTLLLAVAGLWLLFAWLWMLIAAAHGDLEEEENRRNDTCTEGVEGFAGFLLMSIETQTTIGFGSRYPTENCGEGVFMLCLQMIIGIGVEGAVLGMFYVKMTRSKIKDCRKVFSKIAVVCQRDGNLCLMFRLSDYDRSHIVGTQIRAWLLETWRCSLNADEPSEVLDTRQCKLKLEPIGLLLWPLTVVHVIDSSSPLYDVSAKDLLTKKFEIIVSMIGSSDSTGQLTQSRTSYLSSEIHWGHRFQPCMHYDEERNGYIVYRELLSAVETVDTPLCSAKRLDEVLGEIRDVVDVKDTSDTVTSGIGSMTECSSPMELLETDV